MDALGIEPPAFLRRMYPRIDDPIAELKDRARVARLRHGEPPVLTRLRDLELVDEQPSAATHLALDEVDALRYVLGDLDRAESAVRAAAPITPDGAFGGRLMWLRGMIAVSRGDLLHAEALYRDALDALRCSPADALLVAAELVRVLLQESRSAEACALACSLIWLVTPLDGQRVLAAAHADLVRAGLEGRVALTLGRLDDIIRTIKRGRALPRAAHRGNQRS